MLRSKSRSGSIDFGHKNHSSIFSKTISASKLCRGDVLVSQIDSNALVSFDKNPSKATNLSEKRIDRVVIMQEQMGDLEEELKRTKEQLDVALEEKNQSLDELREMKQVAREAAMKMSEALSPKKAAELYAELRTLKGLLSNSTEELKTKDEKIESLGLEVKRAKQFELELAGRDSLLDRLREELNNARASEARATGLLADDQKRIQELEAEVERGRMSELKMLESLEHQTKQVEQTKIELEESKLELASVQEKVKLFETSSRKDSRDLGGSWNKENTDPTNGELESLKSELQLAKEHLTRAQESEKIASLNARSLQDEIGLIKIELKLAIEAEETSKKAMDELALALKEVATEANQAKENLNITQLELEQMKGEVEQLKAMVWSTEKRYEELLDEAKKETDLNRNTADRLRLEAEESVLAWNGKEMGFVSCIKRAEEERALAQHENAKLTESLKAAENMSRAAREENYKLRDILKQAINEANAAKAAAGIARDENSQLKDFLAEKDEALHFVTKENERLRINEAAAHENVKEFKRLLSSASMELKSDSKDPSGVLKSPSSVEEDDEEENTEKKAFTFNLKELKLLNNHDNADETVKHEDPAKAEALKGSIFDTDVSPRSEPHTPKSASNHQRGPSTAFTDDGGTSNSEDRESVDSSHVDDSDSDRNPNRRRKALFRRVGDMIMRKSFHKKELSE